MSNIITLDPVVPFFPQARRFDRDTGDYIELGNVNDALFLRTQPWTVLVFTQVQNTTTDDNGLIGKWGSDANQRQFYLRVDQGSSPENVEVFHNATLLMNTAADTIAVNNWYLIAVSCNGTSAANDLFCSVLTMNGNYFVDEQTATTTGDRPDLTGPIQLGRLANVSDPMGGEISYVSYIKRKLSKEEISKYLLEPAKVATSYNWDLIFCLPMGRETFEEDISMYKNHGAIIGTGSVIVEGPPILPAPIKRRIWPLDVGGALLAGSLAYSLTQTGTLQTGQLLAGNLAYSLVHTGDLQIGKLLAGDLAYSLTHTGEIQIGKFLQGALAYSLTETGNIQVGKFLAGALSYSLTHEGTLQVGGVDLAGDLVYSLTHAGTIQIGKFLSGALTYSLTHTGDLEIGKFLAGALVYSLTHVGTLSLDILLAGDLDYSLTELGDIQIGQLLSGILNYSLTESGDLQIGKFLQGALDYSLTEAGTLTLDILLSGDLNYSLTDVGELQIGKLLDGTLTYSLTETGDIQIGINLAGQETITLTMAGTLTVTAALFRVLVRISESLKTADPASETLEIQKTVGETLIG